MHTSMRAREATFAHCVQLLAEVWHVCERLVISETGLGIEGMLAIGGLCQSCGAAIVRGPKQWIFSCWLALTPWLRYVP